MLVTSPLLLEPHELARLCVCWLRGLCLRDKFKHNISNGCLVRRGGLVRGGSGGAAPSHADKPVGVGGKAGAKWRNQSDQLRIAMAASKGGSQVSHAYFIEVLKR